MKIRGSRTPTSTRSLSRMFSLTLRTFPLSGTQCRSRTWHWAMKLWWVYIILSGTISGTKANSKHKLKITSKNANSSTKKARRSRRSRTSLLSSKPREVLPLGSQPAPARGPTRRKHRFLLPAPSSKSLALYQSQLQLGNQRSFR